MATEYAFEFVHDNLKLSAERQKRLYNRNSGLPTFKAGDSVWRYYPPTAKQKLGKKWQGPFLVVKRITDLTYRIQKTERQKSLVVHVDHLKIYEGRNPVQNWVPLEGLEGRVGEENLGIDQVPDDLILESNLDDVDLTETMAAQDEIMDIIPENHMSVNERPHGSEPIDVGPHSEVGMLEPEIEEVPDGVEPADALFSENDPVVVLPSETEKPKSTTEQVAECSGANNLPNNLPVRKSNRPHKPKKIFDL